MKTITSRLWPLLLVVAVGCSGGKPSGEKKDDTPPKTDKAPELPPVTDPPSVSIGAIEFHQEYSNNPVRADENYKGRRVKLVGTIRRIDDSSVYFLTALDGSPVPCRFRVKSDIAKFNKWEPASVEGTCPGGKAALVDCVPHKE